MDIGVVLVTFNRRDYLKKALLKYENQIKKPQYILVVNNNSSDGTKEMLEEWKKKNNNIDKYVVNIEKNIGGSGGFYTGLEKAMNLDANWIWVADDDAYPIDTAFLEAEKFLMNNKRNNISAICGTVINNGNIDISHRRRLKTGLFKINEENINENEYNKEYFELDLFSYVGSIINKEALKKIGLTEKEYFIYYDDTEHSYRLSKVGKILCIPSIKVIHDVKLQDREKIDWKRYYGIRNNLLFYKKHFPNRYFMYEYCKNIGRILKSISYSDSKVYRRLILKANRDAKQNIKGLDELYKPGWKYDD